MAAGTNPELQNQVIYSVYIRNHTPEGSFLSLVPDLDRIRDLGTDIIWLMPIHPRPTEDTSRSFPKILVFILCASFYLIIFI